MRQYRRRYRKQGCLYWRGLWGGGLSAGRGTVWLGGGSALACCMACVVRLQAASSGKVIRMQLVP
jgi:hypothetical protein